MYLKNFVNVILCFRHYVDLFSSAPEHLCDFLHDFIHAELLLMVELFGRVLPLLVNDAREAAVPTIVDPCKYSTRSAKR